MKLVICGNGFDIHHGLETRYEDYRRYLLKNEKDILEKMSKLEYFDYGLDSVKGNESTFWSDVEENLTYDFWRCVQDLIEERLRQDEQKASMMDLDAILDDETPEPPIDLNLHGSGATALQSFSGLSLYRWFKSIDVSRAEKDEDLLLDAMDYFITFNYTDTLERVYGVPRKHVLHLHGNLNDVHEPSVDVDVHKVLQFGNPNLDISLIPIYLSQAFMESDLAYQYQPCIEEMKCFFSLFTKSLKSNFGKLKSFVDGKEFEEIVIMGHSYLGVDKCYYDEIFVPIYRAVKWTIYSHKDAANAEKFIQQNNLKGVVEKW